MPTHKSSDYKLSAVKYYLSYSKNQVETCKIFDNRIQSIRNTKNKNIEIDGIRFFTKKFQN